MPAQCMEACSGPNPVNQKRKTSRVKHFDDVLIITLMACGVAINQQLRNAVSSSKNNKKRQQIWHKLQLKMNSLTTIHHITLTMIISLITIEFMSN